MCQRSSWTDQKYRPHFWNGLAHFKDKYTIISQTSRNKVSRKVGNTAELHSKTAFVIMKREASSIMIMICCFALSEPSPVFVKRYLRTTNFPEDKISRHGVTSKSTCAAICDKLDKSWMFKLEQLDSQANTGECLTSSRDTMGPLTAREANVTEESNVQIGYSVHIATTSGITNQKNCVSNKTGRQKKNY